MNIRFRQEVPITIGFTAVIFIACSYERGGGLDIDERRYNGRDFGATRRKRPYTSPILLTCG